MSKSYEIYKEKVGGKTWDEKPMMEFEAMPENIKNAWKSIDEHYNFRHRKFHKHLMALLMYDFDSNFRGQILNEFNEQ